MIALDPKTLGETFERRAHGGRGDRTPQSQGSALVAIAAARIDRVRLAVRAQPRPRVAALEWLDPVFVAGHWTPELIELAGGEDVLGRAGAPSRTVTWDAVADAEPEVVIVMPCGYDAARAHTEAVRYTHQLAGLGAHRVVAVDASAYFSRPGPRLTDGVELLAHILHPRLVPDLPEGAEALPVATARARL